MTIVRIAMLMRHVAKSGWFDMRSNFGKYCFRIGVALICFAFLFVVFLILPPIGKHYHIPAMNMAPNLVPGDIIYSSNYRYTFSDDKLPKIGDFITFKPEGGRQIFVKRVIGLPGDKVQIREGRLYLNDTLVERKPIGTMHLHSGFKKKAESYSLYEEQLTQSSKPHQIFEKSDKERLDNTAIYTVPEGNIFVLGDNRDNSYDSRVPVMNGGAGFVPIENIIGEVNVIIFRTKSCRNEEDIFCPKRKFLHTL